MLAPRRSLQERRIVPDKTSGAKRTKVKAARTPEVLPHQEPAVEPAHGRKAEGWVGRPIVRKEESRLVRGCGKFVDDFKLPGMLHMRLLRSPYAHARITGVDVSAAEK